MPEALTAILLLAVVGGVVYVVGTERTAQAAGTAAEGGKRVAKSGYTAGIAGGVIGIELGNQLLQAIAAEPFAASTVIAGIFGALGIEGLLGGISGVQFLLIGVTIFLAVIAYRRRM